MEIDVKTRQNIGKKKDSIIALGKAFYSFCNSLPHIPHDSSTLQLLVSNFNTLVIENDKIKERKGTHGLLNGIYRKLSTSQQRFSQTYDKLKFKKTGQTLTYNDLKDLNQQVKAKLSNIFQSNLSMKAKSTIKLLSYCTTQNKNYLHNDIQDNLTELYTWETLCNSIAKWEYFKNVYA